MKLALRFWWLAAILGVWAFLFFPDWVPILPAGVIATKDVLIAELREANEQLSTTPATLPDTVKVYVTTREIDGVRIIYRTQVDTVETIRQIIRTIPVEGSYSITIPDEGPPVVKVKNKGLCLKPKAVAILTAQNHRVKYGLGVRLAFVGDYGLAAVATASTCGMEVGWRLRSLGLRNTAVGVGASYHWRDSNWTPHVGVGLFF